MFSSGLCGMRHFNAAGAPANYIGANAPLDHCFASFYGAVGFILGFDNAIGDDFFLTDVHLRLFLERQCRTNARDLVVLHRALGLATPHAQLIELSDEILGLNTQFLGQ